jgi:hypothetical protein
MPVEQAGDGIGVAAVRSRSAMLSRAAEAARDA